MRFRIKHVTRYVYEQPVSHSHNEVRLAPLDGSDQKRVAFNLQISPDAEITEYRDSFDNLVHSIAIDPPHRELVISSYSIVDRLEVAASPATRITIREYLAGDDARTTEFGDFLNPSRYVPFSDRLRRFFWSVRPLLSEDVTAYVERMIAYVHAQFAYDRATTHVHSTVEDILTSGGGVCQDFAHLSIGLLRLAGIPARYVSGYLAPAPRSSAGGPPPELASHAWIEALLPSAGWTGFDPTHQMRTTIRHIGLAIGRDYNDLPPVSGVYHGNAGQRRMSYELDIGLDESDAREQSST
jgi:transglutaminase-like putative cysteine protease